jgi:hypothetical protein
MTCARRVLMLASSVRSPHESNGRRSAPSRIRTCGLLLRREFSQRPRCQDLDPRVSRSWLHKCALTCQKPRTGMPVRMGSDANQLSHESPTPGPVGTAPRGDLQNCRMIRRLVRRFVPAKEAPSAFTASQALIRFTEGDLFPLDTPFEQIVYGTFMRSRETFTATHNLLAYRFPVQLHGMQQSRPQSFRYHLQPEGAASLARAGRPARPTDSTVAVVGHAVPTSGRLVRHPPGMKGADP